MLETVQLSAYFEAPVILLYFDHFLTIADEVEYIWKGEWSLVTFLYLFTKYFAIFDTIFVFLIKYLRGPSPIACLVLWHCTSWSYLIGLNVAEAIFTKRTLALWTDKPWLGRLYWGSLVLGLPVGGWLVERVVLSVQFSRSPNLELYSGCFTTHESKGLWIAYAWLLAYETILFLLTVPKVRYRKEDREHLGRKPLSYVIYRDGFQFYVYLLIVSIINIVGILTLKGGLAVSLTRIHRTLHAILSARLVINLRKATKYPHSSRPGFGSNFEDGEAIEEEGGMEFASLDMAVFDETERNGGDRARGSVSGYDEEVKHYEDGTAVGEWLRVSDGSEGTLSRTSSTSDQGSDQCLV